MIGMTYAIFDAGNLVISFEGEEDAYRALERLAEESPDSSGGLLVVVFDAAGNAIANRAPGERIASAA